MKGLDDFFSCFGDELFQLQNNQNPEAFNFSKTATSLKKKSGLMHILVLQY